MISYRASRFKKPDSGYELYIVDGKNERKWYSILGHDQ
jgi:hypothetical protein